MGREDMIGRMSRHPSIMRLIQEVEPKSFDDFELKLGDVMRGERATMGKSLLDVQRELQDQGGLSRRDRRRRSFDAFDTPGFVAGYVRSYARYLGLDPD